MVDAGHWCGWAAMQLLGGNGSAMLLPEATNGLLPALQRCPCAAMPRWLPLPSCFRVRALAAAHCHAHTAAGSRCCPLSRYAHGSCTHAMCTCRSAAAACCAHRACQPPPGPALHDQERPTHCCKAEQARGHPRNEPPHRGPHSPIATAFHHKQRALQRSRPAPGSPGPAEGVRGGPAGLSMWLAP